MKKLLIFIISCTLFSCISISDHNEKEDVELLGKVDAEFLSYQVLHIINESSVKQTAYTQLLEKAKEEYGNDIDIHNIDITSSASGWNFAIGFTGLLIFGNFQDLLATGDVVRVYSTGQTEVVDQIAIEISETFMGDPGQKIAIFDFMNLDGKKSLLGKYIAEQTMTYLFQNTEMNIVERSLVDQIVSEWDFGVSGIVSESSASEIGQLLGASSIVIGTLTKIGNRISVNARIVDVETSRVLSTASMDLKGSDYIDMYYEIVD